MFCGAISENIIDEIVKSVEKTENATTFNDKSGNSELRKSRVSWIKDKKVLDMLFDFVDVANRNAFNVSLYKQAPIQYTEYHGDESGHYNWHHDIDWLRNDGLDRKLSVTVQLSNPDEYEGGKFSFGELEAPKEEMLKKKGTVLVFPSYIQHKVEPVTKGVRKSLVSWFEGPQWR